MKHLWYKDILNLRSKLKSESFESEECSSSCCGYNFSCSSAAAVVVWAVFFLGLAVLHDATHDLPDPEFFHAFGGKATINGTLHMGLDFSRGGCDFISDVCSEGGFVEPSCVGHPAMFRRHALGFVFLILAISFPSRYYFLEVIRLQSFAASIFLSLRLCQGYHHNSQESKACQHHRKKIQVSGWVM